jgi:hypothetical protein
MIEARSDVTMPVSSEAAFAAATDLDHADWLPAVRGVRRVGGAAGEVGSRYSVEVGLVGRHLSGVLVCREIEAPTRAVYALENGLDLSIQIGVRPVAGGCNLELVARYTVPGPFGGAVERASVGAARREVARAVEQLSAQFARKG